MNLLDETRRASRDLALCSCLYFVSDVMGELVEQAVRVAGCPEPVLITGETGTGKELVARLIYSARNCEGPFVAENAAAIPQPLFESVMFGHAKGSFSGAHTSEAGLVEAAQDGCLFLDEVGELPTTAQAKLLRALQEKEIRRVGERHTRAVATKLIVATNRDLEAMIQEGSFREDLFWRVSCHQLHLPPLRERRADIAPIADAFARSRGFELRAEASDRLVGFPTEWRGNIRELQQILSRSMATAQDGILRAQDLRLPQLRSAPRVPKSRARVLGSQHSQILVFALEHAAPFRRSQIDDVISRSEWVARDRLNELIRWSLLYKCGGAEFSLTEEGRAQALYLQGSA
jgi:two-component system response regulator HydG